MKWSRRIRQAVRHPKPRRPDPELAQAALTKIRTIHRPDPTGSWCAHCEWEWPCRTFIYAGGGS